jgi:maltose alpha-D-glucosyltransferase/alpha-amylase
MTDDDPLWYRDAVIYELHVRAFHDSAGDGIGDFRGLAERLDYLKDLGVSALWLLPFYPSPLLDDGYDIADFTGVHPSYGTLADFKHLLREAHRRDLRVITELVLNHTSDQHPWFQRARRAPPASAWRNFYVWSDTPQRYGDARVIFKDFESSNWSWDPVAAAYYWHRFYSHQPDLNWDNPAVWKAMLRVLDFWLDLGVDGLRLDAVPYLYERDGTSCESLPETHATLKALRRHVDRKFRNRMLLAEANQWPEDAAAYFGDGDESHMAFHFPLMPRMFMALRMEDRYPIVDILSQTPAIPDTCQWALFLRNHDELTLEMVTDEERDYMYRVYAQDRQARINLGIRRRLAPLLGNDRRTMELMTALLFSLPGTPVLYYGDEIGMGDNIFLGDRSGVRTPMQWSTDRNAGFSRANPQRLYLPVIIDPDFSYETVNVASQQDNPYSLLRWMKRLIALRRRMKAFGRGSLEFLYPTNRKVLAFLRQWERERILVVANLSRHAQFVELDLSALRETVPVETFGGACFPPVSERPYLLTLGPHAFYWFEMRPASEAFGVSTTPPEAEPPWLASAEPWQDLFRDGFAEALKDVLPRLVAARPWSHASGPQAIKSAEIVDAVPLAFDSTVTHVALVKAEYAEGVPETHVLPLAFAAGERAGQVRSDHPQDVLARLDAGGEGGVVYCALRDPGFARAVLDAVGRRRRFRGTGGEIAGIPGPAYRQLRGDVADAPAPFSRATGRGNDCVFYADRFVLKLFRRAEPGPHPDVEVPVFLTETASFQHTPPLAGRIDYRPAAGESATLGVLKGYVRNEGDAWQLFVDHVGRAMEQVGAERAPLVPAEPLLDLSAGEVSPLAHEVVGAFLETVRLLGQRTAELHLALASHPEDPVFAPEHFTPYYQRSLYQSMRNLSFESLDLLRRHLPALPPAARAEAERVLRLNDEILRRLRGSLDRPLAALRTRIHGDYHLGHVLWTGRDFAVIDFQGDPAQPISTRRLKRSPVRDVAGMIHSFHLAAHRGLARHVEQGGVSAERAAVLEPWADYWSIWVSSAFLRAYLRSVPEASYLPPQREDLGKLLFVYLLEKAMQELGAELPRRPDRVRLLLQRVVRAVEAER